MSPLWWSIALLVAFLFGSFPTGFLIARAKGIDIRKHGSGNIGATNVGRILGPKAWLLCFAGDFLKGFAPVLAIGVFAGVAGRWDAPAAPTAWWLAAMAAAMAGHMFCPWLGFKGGKGVATGLGAVLAIVPVLSTAGLVALGVFLVAVTAWRYVSLAAMLAACTLPLSVVLIALIRGQHTGLSWDASPWASPAAIATALMAGVVVFKHRSNIQRLRAGTEPKVGAKKTSPAQVGI
ncbi:MAG TPA: glycerol-3-phosphate 1-O-acyltransferase PlsY [Phycisphaerales bacterium]